MPDKLPELIVCRNDFHAELVRKRVSGKPHIRVMGDPHISDLCASTFARVTICEGVDLDRDVAGQGSLRELIRQRQMTWGDQALLLEL